MKAISPASWRAINLSLLAIVALFALLLAMKHRTPFAWVTALAAIATAVSMYFDLHQRELGEGPRT